METIIEEPQKVVKVHDESTGTWKFVKNDVGPLKSIEAIETMLRRLGLSKNEIRVYLYLARSRERKASDISEVLNLHRTETYKILRDLEKKGLVSSVFEKPLKFIATPFDRAVDALIETKKLRIQRLERRKQDLIDVWMSLPQPEFEEGRKEVFQVLEGEEQIDLKANEIVQNAQREISVFASEEDLSRFYHSGFIEQLEKLSKKNLAIKLLTNNSPKSRFFVERVRLLNKMYVRSGVEAIPTFILADREQLLFMIRTNHDPNSKKTSRPKVGALWTNYGAFIKALGALFVELWRGEA
jgi:sugar-specific transcriptional regulator TrmB